MDQFRRASETQAAVTITVPAVTHEGPLQRPIRVPPAQAPGPVSHIPTQGRRVVYQDLNDGNIGTWLVMADFPSSGCDSAHYCPLTFHQVSHPCTVSTSDSLVQKWVGISANGAQRPRALKFLKYSGGDFL